MNLGRPEKTAKAGEHCFRVQENERHENGSVLEFTKFRNVAFSDCGNFYERKWVINVGGVPSLILVLSYNLKLDSLTNLYLIVK